MSEDGQLDFEDIAEEPSEAKKTAPRKRRSKPSTDPDPTPTVEAENGKAEVPAEPDAESGPQPAELDEPTAEEAAASAEEPEAFGEPPSPRAFFLTNSMNLNGVLSSRILAPRGSFHKYYADLLELTPGFVPILKVNPSDALIKKVTAEKGAGTAVLLELDHSVLVGQPGSELVAYLSAALLADVRSVHFPDEKSLREHRARGYSNVHPHDHLLRVSPELFEASSESEMLLEAPSGDGRDGPTTDWQRLDRIRGALSAAFAASENGEALAVTAGLLGAPIPEEVVSPPWLTWTGLTGVPETPSSETHAEQADRLIFQAAYDILGSRDQSESWSASEVLDAVAEFVAASRPTDEAKAIIDRNLQHVREIVNIERDFEPFRNPGSPHVAAKALLLVLLRPDLEQLLKWPTTETGADDTTRVVAAVLSGRLRGAARETVSLRSREVDDLTARWAVRTAAGEPARLGRVEFVANDARTTLLLDDREVETSTPLVPDPLPIYEALGDSERGDIRRSVALLFGWPIKTIIRLPEGAEVVQEDGSVAIASVEPPLIETMVDESDFVERLRRLTGIDRRQAVRALQRSHERT